MTDMSWVLSDEQVIAARALVAAGETKASVARSLGVGRTMLLHALGVDEGRVTVKTR